MRLFRLYLVFIVFAFFASVFTIGKVALLTTQPFFLVGSRMLVAGILLLAYQFFKDPKSLKIQKKDLFPFLKLALFNIYLTNILEFWGLQYLTSFKACFIYSLSPFAAAFLSFVVFSEKMTLRKWQGLAIGCVGFIPILLSQDSTETEPGNVLFFSLAEIAVLAACVCNVYGWILMKQIVRDNGHSPFVANGFSMIIGGTFSLLHSSMTERWDPLPTTDFFLFVECGLALIVVSNFIGYNLYGYLLKRYSATFLSFAGFTTPMFAAFYGWLFLNETIGLEFYFSAIIVFAGLYVFNKEELKVSIQQ